MSSLKSFHYAPILRYVNHEKIDVNSMLGGIEIMTAPYMSQDKGGPGTDVATNTKVRVEKPSMYKVLLLNDDYTPMDFVILVLQRFFHKDHQEAVEIMMHVHNKGIGVCGVYTYEVAETKVAQVMSFAREHEHPLQCTTERD